MDQADRLADPVREHSVDAAIVAKADAAVDASVAVLIAAGWRVVADERINDVRIRFLQAPGQ